MLVDHHINDLGIRADGFGRDRDDFVDEPTLLGANDEEDVVFRLAGRLADDPRQGRTDEQKRKLATGLLRYLLSAVKRSGSLNSRMHGCVRLHRLDGCE